MTTKPARTLILVLLALASLAAFGLKEESLDELIARAEAARPNDRPALYIEIARRKAEAADKLYDAGNPEGGKAALQDVVDFSKKATDAAIATGKKMKNIEITLRKMSEKFRDIKRTVAFDDQAPIQQTIDQQEKMRTDLLSAMFGKKRSK
ncbi:MAG: hypothetical protein ACRD20_03235 [Terriglobales bacterium]